VQILAFNRHNRRPMNRLSRYSRGHGGVAGQNEKICDCYLKSDPQQFHHRSRQACPGDRRSRGNRPPSGAGDDPDRASFVSCAFRCNRRAVRPGLHEERTLGLLNMANTPPQVIAPLSAPAISPSAAETTRSCLRSPGRRVARPRPLMNVRRSQKVLTLSFWYTI
jgi:hypothetical protein